MKRSLSTSLFLTCAITLLACQPITYFAEGRADVDAFTLDADAPVQRFAVSVCWEGDADPSSVYTRSFAATPEGSDPAVRMTIEEDGEPFLLQTEKPTAESVPDTYVEWRWDAAEDACLTGIVVRFELDDPGAAAGLAPITVDWSMWAGLSSEEDPEVDELDVTVIVEPL